MSKANSKWIELLNQSGYTLEDEQLSLGELSGVKVNEAKKEYRLVLSFPKLVDTKVLFESFESVKKYLMDNCKLNNVRFSITEYNEECYDYNLIYKYFQKAIEVWSKQVSSVKILLKYPVDVQDDSIVIRVASEADKNNVIYVMDNIMLFFKNYGLSNVKIDIEIDNEVDSFGDIVKTQHRIEEEKKEARLTELHYERLQKAKETQEETSYKPKYRKNDYPIIKIEEIPDSSMEIEDFKNIRNTEQVQVEGVIISAECRTIRNARGEYHLFTGVIGDETDSIVIKTFYREDNKHVFEKDIAQGKRVMVRGKVGWDAFANSVVISIQSVVVFGIDTSRERFDGAEEKRIELHAHTKMSVLDSILDVDEYVDQAVRYGHKALAVTDHANCHVLPAFFSKAKSVGIKPIAGCEGYYVDDTKLKIALTNESIKLSDATYVIFDIETTGFSISFCEIIEIGAVKVKHGMIVDSFSEFVKPTKPISKFITDLTDITNEMVESSDNIEGVIKRFKEFINGAVLVAHNAKFDTGFIYSTMKDYGIFEGAYPCIDTLELAHVLYSDTLKKFNLGHLAKSLKVEVEQLHRAIHDARTTNNVFMRMLGDLQERNITNYSELNSLINIDELAKLSIPRHINLLIKNKTGLKNFYKILSDANTTHFNKEPRMLRSVIEEYREGILVGSGCVNGEIWRNAFEKTEEDIEKVLEFYDYIEVQPPVEYLHLFRTDEDETDALNKIKETIEKIVRVGAKHNKLVVATGDVHHLIKEDAKYRNIYLSVPRPSGGGPHELASCGRTLDMHFRSTTEMLDEFDFLPAEIAHEIIVTNTNIIADMIEEFDIFPKKLFVPRDDYLSYMGVPSMEKALIETSNKTLKSMYGENPPKYVQDRLDIELEKIIGNGYASVYYISHMMIKNSNDAGYVVGSRGSVGSSFAATMMNITEVNPLKPHYRCPKCKYSAFKFSKAEKAEFGVEIDPLIDAKLQSVDVGFDLPYQTCPVCGEVLLGDGVDIAFETFLGFKGDKVPDIDLNFSGEYQATAHSFVQSVFGVDGSFRAGTISAVKDKTAFAYVRDYCKKQNIELRKCEMERIASFIAGAKRTTGQHPGGIVVVPDDIEYTDIFPVQYPPVGDPDNVGELRWRTSHYDYHRFESNLLKLDILGHDDPTVIKTLMNYVHEKPELFPFNRVEDIPIADPDVISLFSSKTALKLQGNDGDLLSSGTKGVPEYGTEFVRGMLETIKPSTVGDIIKVSGLSHGTDVWQGNAEILFKGELEGFPKVPFSEVIACRDDIMLDLMKYDLPAVEAFAIMESVRKGKGLKTSQEELMRKCKVPEWYIYSCKKIKYMFPKAHATAYVIMALRIGWFKVHRPIYYYAAYFSKRAKRLDAEVFANGKNAIRNKINEIETMIKNKSKDVTDKDKDLLTELHIALEMVLRGYTFKQIDLEKSKAVDFTISDDLKSLYLPFIAIDSLGETVAKSIEDARSEAPFISKKDFETRTSINKTQYAKMHTLGIFDELPDDNTLL